VGDGTELWRIDDGSTSPLWKGDGLYRSVSTDDAGFWLARVEGTSAKVLRLGLDGAPGDGHDFEIEDDARVKNIAQAPDGVYVSTIDSFAGSALFRIGASDGAFSSVIRSNAPLSGPVLVDGGPLWVESEGKLVRLTSDRGVTDAGSERNDLIGLGLTGTMAYASTGNQLYRLDASGVGEKLFDLSELGPPEMKIDDRACAADWSIFKTDLARAGVTLDPVDGGATSGAAPRTTDARAKEHRAQSCSVSPPAAAKGALGAVLTSLALSIALTRRARRSRPIRKQNRAPALFLPPGWRDHEVLVGSVRLQRRRTDPRA
jgi:hypothetical protein